MENAAEIIKQKAAFIQSLKQTSGNEKESVRIAKLDKVTALNFAANDATFRNAWESVLNQTLF